MNYQKQIYILDKQRKKLEELMIHAVPVSPLQAFKYQEQMFKVEKEMEKLQIELNHMKQKSINHKIQLGLI
jgi:hypothetical protein